MIEELSNIGLTQNEKKVYLSLLDTGTAKVAVILEHARINSGKIYEILSSLQQKGLVSESRINKVRHFTAASPKQLLAYCEQRKEAIEKEEEKIRESIPFLIKRQKTKPDEIKSSTYLGIKGLRAAADEALEDMQKGEEILGMGATKNKDPKYGRFWMNWVQEGAMEKNIKHRLIFSERSEYAKDWEAVKGVTARYLSGLTPVAVLVLGKGHVLLVNYENPVTGILIKGKNINTSFRQFFEQLWRSASA